METFSKARDFTEYPRYQRDRSKVLSRLELIQIDAPIRDLIQGFGKLPQCFTLQCCYGHFGWKGHDDPQNLHKLPLHDKGPVRYRIAYLALCIEQGDRGTYLRDRIAAICDMDKDYVQFGSPEWFWQQYPNSYALQVEPGRFAFRDAAMLDHAEALHVQSVRDAVFQGVRELLEDREIQRWAV